MTLYLIDTDWIVDSLHGQRQAAQTLIELAPEGLAVSYITYAELYQGAHYASDPDNSLRVLDEFIEGVELVPLNLEIMQRFAIIRGHLQQQGTPIGEMDLLIAATALNHDLTIVTRNRRHFERVPDLKLYQEI
jgi:tRNA(fMet)-specific endonuclease VapC